MKRETGHRALLCAILLVAAAVRLYGINFGLPSLNDPDEPLFVMLAIDMLRHHTLNPHWFGHPGTITLYSLALTLALTGAFYLATGQAVGLKGLIAAAYSNPGLFFLPARVMIAACGVLCVWLTWRLGRKLGGPAVGLTAAALLAVNAIHVEQSQIIRTDIQAGVFMLLCALSSGEVLRRGWRRDYVLAGLFAGLACAVKWPAALIFISPLSATFYHVRDYRNVLVPLFLLGFSAFAGLVIASPYLLIDYHTVIVDLTAEGRPYHPGGTGTGFLGNFLWYLDHPLLSSLGVLGLVLAIVGLVWRVRRDPAWAVAVLPGVLVFFVLLCAQSLRWDRWLVPFLPFLAIAAARALCGLGELAVGKFGRNARWAMPVALVVVMVPMLLVTRARAIERQHDTRQMASGWILAHAPPGSSVLVEDAAFDLVHAPYDLRFPLGAAGCLPAAQLLGGHISSGRVEHDRAGSPSVDFGHVAKAQLTSCRTQYAVFSHLALYQQEPEHFGSEIAQYEDWLAHADIVAVFRPVPGQSGGPTIYVARARPQ